MKRLRANEKCPLHGGLYCCGRERPAYEPGKYAQHGVTKFPDGREKCSPSELTRRKGILLKRDPVCAACGRTFDDYRDVELAHVESKGMGGGKHDDRWENLVLMHLEENREQGSRSLSDYLAWRIEKRSSAGGRGIGSLDVDLQGYERKPDSGSILETRRSRDRIRGKGPEEETQHPGDRGVRGKEHFCS